VGPNQTAKLGPVESSEIRVGGERAACDPAAARGERAPEAAGGGSECGPADPAGDCLEKAVRSRVRRKLARWAQEAYWVSKRMRGHVETRGARTAAPARGRKSAVQDEAGTRSNGYHPLRCSALFCSMQYPFTFFQPHGTMATELLTQFLKLWVILACQVAPYFYGHFPHS
jgi:hypothetical protein